MPSRLKTAIGAVKDRTSIGIARVSSTTSSKLGIAVLKATSHHEAPLHDRHLDDTLRLLSSDPHPRAAATCARAIRRRLARTRNWLVALKSLTLLLRILQHRVPAFPNHVARPTRRGGAKILSLSAFRDDSAAGPRDHAAFVRAYALYLDERLDCFLSGKLPPLFLSPDPPALDLNSAVLLDRIPGWQRLLDRAIAVRPGGAARSNRVVQASLHAVLQESFSLYRDISDGLTVLLDGFFQLQYQSCVSAFQTCVRATKQFDELCSFYSICKGIGVGKTSEYPSVQKISEELVETLQEFLKDQSAQPTGDGKSPVSPNQLLSPPHSRHGSRESDETSTEKGPDAESDGASEIESGGEDGGAEAAPSNEEDCWELELFDSASLSKLDSPEADAGHGRSSQAAQHTNPFLGDEPEPSPAEDFAVAPTFQATPTFCAGNAEEGAAEDPFAAEATARGGPVCQQKLQQEQRLWVEQQNKIMAKRLG